MKIKLIRLTLLNFRGIRSLDIRLGKVTNVFGKNEAGKTTIMDAFLWNLFGKDSADRKDFEIKTLGPDNQPYHRMDHEVTAELDVDGETIVLKRVYKENWTKKKGESTPVFDGHTTSFFWNDVPLKMQEYQAKVNGLLNEGVFKLITNAGYFNSLEWPQRRDILLQIAGNISNQDVLDNISRIHESVDFAALTAALTNKKSIKEFKSELAAKKKTIKDQLDLIPSRIDEATRSLPEKLEYAALEILLGTEKATLETIDSMLTDKTKAQKDQQLVITGKINEIQECRIQKQQIEFDAKNSVKDLARQREQVIADLRRDLRTTTDDGMRHASYILTYKGRKTDLEKERADLLAKWHSINAEVLHFHEGDSSCPTCKREYPADELELKKEELTKNFNADKAKRLVEISERGKKLAADITIVNAEIENYVAKGQESNNEIARIQNSLYALEEENNRKFTNENLEVQRSIATNTIYQALNEKIALLEEEVNVKTPDDNKSELVSRKKEVTEKIAGLQKQIDTKEQREKVIKRVAELQSQEKEMAGELAGLEGKEYSILLFEKAKMDTLQNRLNGRFKLAKFKLFEDQINGGEVPCCETLYKGVPYPVLNTAARVQVSVDIISTLSEHYGIVGPVFIDNRESVTNIPDTESQIINLIVSPKDEKLKITSDVEEMATA